MDKPTFIVELAKALAWPLLVAGLAAFFRREVVRLVATASRVFRRAKTVEALGVKVALEERTQRAVDIAAQATRDEIEVVKDRLTKGEIAPEEKAKLVDDLQTKAEELAAIQLLRESWGRAEAPSTRPYRPFVTSQPSPGALQILDEIVDAIGRERVRAFDREHRTEAVADEINRVVAEISASSGLVHGLNAAALVAIRVAGIIDQNDEATSLGVYLALKSARERPRAESA